MKSLIRSSNELQRLRGYTASASGTSMLGQQTNEERELHQQRQHEAVSFVFFFAAGCSFCCYPRGCDEEFFSDVIILV
jgi:hypothetical protein